MRRDYSSNARRHPRSMLSFVFFLFTYIERDKRQRAMILNQQSSHLHEDLQQLDAAAQKKRHGFVSNPDILRTEAQLLSLCY